MPRPKPDLRAMQLEWQQAESRNEGLGRLPFDPTGSGPARAGKLGRTPLLLEGYVVDGVPYLNGYKVFVDEAMPVITATPLAALLGTMGSREIASYTAGTRVLVMWQPGGSSHGYILGAIPSFGVDGSKALSDVMITGGRTGLQRDRAFSMPFRLRGRGVADWSAGRPLDDTQAGERGFITDTGVRMLVDSFHAQFGLGEGCGIYAFLWDQLLRISGLNLQIRSGGFDWESVEDDGEIYDVRGRVIYPWEALGAGRKDNTDLVRDFDAQAVQIDEPHYGHLEPKHDNQIPIHRLLEFGGYLGQGGKRVLQAPTDQTLWRLGEEGPAVSLFHENLSLTGAWRVQAADSISIVRTPYIPRLKRKKRPEDADGDNPENYKASGAYGGGNPPQVKARPTASGLTNTPHGKLAAIDDFHAHAFNWDNPHPFHYHTQDWEAEELADSEFDAPEPLNFSELAGHDKMQMGALPTKAIDVDHRYGQVEYALATQYITMLPDGGLAIGDGFGAEIKLSGGSIIESCPGDHWRRAGRNIVDWGGRDVMSRAKNCVDISATEGSVRTKGGKHNMMTAIDGVVMIDGRGGQSDIKFEEGGQPRVGEDASAGGVIVRSKGAPLVLYGAGIYGRTGGGSVGSGSIILDAAQGQAALITKSSSTINFLHGGAHYDAFMAGNETIACSIFASSYTILDGLAVIEGFAMIDGGVYTNGSIFVDTGHIYTAEASRGSIYVGGVGPESLQSEFDSMRDKMESFYQELGQYHQQALDERYYAQYKAGNGTVMSTAEFSFRTDEQYGTAGTFHIFEDRWQRMARKAGSGTTWTERTVTGQLGTSPYPGNDAFLGSVYMQLNDTMVDENGLPRDRGGSPGYYTAPQYGTAQPTSLNSYQITG